MKRRQTQFFVFFRRQIDDDQPVDARAFGIRQETFHAVDIDRIVVAHEHDRRRVIAAAEVADQRQRALHVLPGGQRPQFRGLDRRPVRHRIGERHAKLDQVGAGLRQRLDDGERGLVVRVAGHDEGHQRGAAFVPERGKAAIDAGGHRALLKCRATVSRSLSPRPERLTTIR